MSAEEKKALIRPLWDGLGRGDLSVMDEMPFRAFMNHRIDGTAMDRARYNVVFGGGEVTGHASKDGPRCSPKENGRPFASL